MKNPPLLLLALAGALALPAAAQQIGQAQLVIRGAGTASYAVALPDALVAAGDPAAAAPAATFNAVLWSDLTVSGRVTLVGKGFYPGPAPAAPADLAPAAVAAWTDAPVQAQRLVAASLRSAAGALVLDGYLYDLTLPNNYVVAHFHAVDQPNAAGARLLAHKFADQIVVALGGLPYATSRIVYVHTAANGFEDVWMCDYDGFNPHPITHFGGYILGPRLSPDGTRLSFSGQRPGESHQIHVVSLLTGKDLPFARFKGETGPPSWSPDGSQLAFSSSMNGNGVDHIFVSDPQGGHLRQITRQPGSDDFSPVWNPKTGAQIVFSSDRGSQPHLYLMDADGGNVTPLVTEGYAVDPSWSPNGTELAFAWVREGGENSGAFDIWTRNLTQPPGLQQNIQLTHNQQDNDCPSWGPDGARIVFQSGQHANSQLFTVLANGGEPTQLTHAGRNESAGWSVH